MSAQTIKAEAPVGASVWVIGIMLAMANFLAVLDTTIANVSVPNIAGNLGASASQGAWVITSYAVAEAITVPLTGWLANRFGTVRVFVTAMVGFGVCSFLCGLAPSLGWLVLFRVMQGLMGGPLLPLSQTLLIHVFPKKQLPAAMALWVVTTLTAPIAGPILGGFLCDTFGWPSIFLVNVPIALICAPVILGMLRSKETPTTKTRVDTIGLSLLVVWVGALQLMLDLGKEHEWFASPMIIGLAVIAVVGFLAFLIWELTEEHPIVSLKVFASPGYAVSMLVIAIGFGAFMATNVLTPLWLQTNMGYTATWAGLACGLLGVLAIPMAPVAAKLSGVVDLRKLVCVGLLWLGAICFLRGGMTSAVSYGQVATLMLVMGIGMPLFFLPLNTLALSSIDERMTADGAGMMNFIRTLAGAFAISMVNTAWEEDGVRNQAELAGSLHGADAVMGSLVAQGASQAQATVAVTGIVQGQSVLLATNHLMLLCSALFAVAAAAIWLAPKPARVTGPALGH